ncbi:MAG: MMPL family transporter, partial [Chloroflexota bacterium]
MVGPQNDIAIVRVTFSSSNPEQATIDAQNAIDAWIAEHAPEGLAAYQTGEGPIINNTTESVEYSAHLTTRVTIALVIILLLLIYRSPVSPLVPLVAVTVAYLISRGIVAFLGAHVMTITSYANLIMIVVMYGAGTDYCLFLISRFREEMADTNDTIAATTETVHRVGETIASSAATIFVGFMAMVFAEMGIFNTTGPALAIGIVLSLLAGLTLVPALLATLGQRAFWPGKAHHRATGRYYAAVSQFVSSRPLLTIIVIVALMAPLSYYALTQPVSYNLLGDLPDDKSSVIGYELMEDSLGAGQIAPLTVVVTGRDPAHVAREIAELTGRLDALPLVDEVRGLNTPLGKRSGEFAGLLRVDRQLALAGEMLGAIDPSAGAGMDPAALGSLLQGARGYFDLLAERFPQVADDPNLTRLRETFGSPLTLIQRQDALPDALAGLAETFAALPDAYLLPSELGGVVAALPAEDNGLSADLFGQLTAQYLTADATAFKLDVMLSGNTQGYAAMDTVNDIRAILEDYQDGGEAVVAGATAINTDIRDTMDRDLVRAILYVMIGIFVVLLIMLRSVVAPLYLIATVVLSFLFTLGLTNLVFQHLWLQVEGLTWYVPFFVFVFLVALGVDYSIFLIGRIKEEIPRHGVREGVHVAVAATGAIITSAGLILAGTFGALMVGEVAGLIEIGFAVAAGVLIDTFVVRTMLVPALTTVLGRWAWWPGPLSQRARRGERVTAQPAAD